MNGKGDTPRPRSVDSETFAERWARTFGGSTAAQPARLSDPPLAPARTWGPGPLQEYFLDSPDGPVVYGGRGG